MNDYYVYAHIRLDTETIFYIGKGRGSRAFRKGRSLHWKNIVKKHGYIIKLLETNLSEEQSFVSERNWIQQLKKVGQCEANYSLGGEGCSGYTWTESQRNNMSKIQKSKSKAIVEGHKKQAQKLKGRTKESHEGLKIISQKNSGSGNGRAIFNVLTPDGTFETILEAAEYYGISTAAVHQRIKSPNFKWKKVLK